MQRRLPAVLLTLALLVGCGGQQAAQTDPTPERAATATITAMPVPPAATPLSGATVVYRVPDDGSLRAVDRAGGVEVVLGDPTEPGQQLPWSAAPDGRTIALVSGSAWLGRQEQPPRAALWTVGVDGANPRRLLDLIGTTPMAGSFVNDWIALVNQTFQSLPWTPDGRAVIVASAHAGQIDLYAVEVASGTLQRLTNTPAVEFGAIVAPDGSTLAYGSTSSFGTGAGWADLQAWQLPLVGGEPRPALQPEHSTEPPAALSIAGWLSDGTLVVQTSSMGVVSSTIWLTGDDTPPRPLYSAPGQAVLALQGDQLLFADQIPGQAGGLWSWRTGETIPHQRARLASVDALYTNPYGDEALICTSERGSGGGLLWSQGKLRSIGGGCGQPAWSADRRVALPADSASAAAGLVVGLEDGAELGLGQGALPIGWSDGTLLFFGPRGSGATEWQLLSSDSAGIRPIAPIGGAPAAARLVPHIP